jgi:hypothetical protein
MSKEWFRKIVDREPTDLAKVVEAVLKLPTPNGSAG